MPSLHAASSVRCGTVSYHRRGVIKTRLLFSRLCCFFAFSEYAVYREVGEKASRGSKWKVLDKAKKYLTMPVHQGSVPEEVGEMLLYFFFHCVRTHVCHLVVV